MDFLNPMLVLIDVFEAHFGVSLSVAIVVVCLW